MKRLTLSNVLPELNDTVAGYHRSVLSEIEQALSQSSVVVVGMTVNPFVKKARKALDDAGISYTYLEYGGYFSQWKPRLAIKMWSGWPTFPQVFVNGALVGGAQDLERLMADGRLNELLNPPAAA